jgi:hypothetical protein
MRLKPSAARLLNSSSVITAAFLVERIRIAAGRLGRVD